MPNTGKPSRDCHLCRSRRVKCDLTRPQCNRCVKYGRECPGYRDQQAMIFRNANSNTIKRAKQDQGQKEQSSDLAGAVTGDLPSNVDSSHIVPYRDESSGSARDDTVSPPRRPRLPPKAVVKQSVPKSMAQHWTAESVPILLDIYKQLEFLRNAFRAFDREGPLLWAAHLFTRTYITNMRYPTTIHKESFNQNRQELGTYMGKVLASVSSALKQPDSYHRDDVLATVWLLANYETLIGSIVRVGNTSAWNHHCDGLHGILKSRGIGGLLTSQGRHAFWPSYGLLQVRALSNSEECPPETTQWMAIIQIAYSPPEEKLLVACALFVQSMARVQKRLFNIMVSQDHKAARQEYRTLVASLETAQDEYTHYSNWWLPRMTKVYDFVFRIRDAAHIRTNSMLVFFINFLTHDPHCQIPEEELVLRRAACITMCRQAADTVLKSAPTVIEPLKTQTLKSPELIFDAFKVLWPLICVYNSASTRPDQKAEAEQMLSFLGNEIGIRQGLKSHIRRDVLLPSEVYFAKSLSPLSETVQ